MLTPKFAETHNLIAFLEKSKESSRLEEIIDFLNANQIRYALTVNPTIYTSCIKWFWAIAKVKTVNGERQLQALVDKKKSRVLALETTKSNQDLEIESLKKRVKSVEKRKKSRTSRFKRLRKVRLASRVESSNDASLGAQEDASKQGRKIANLDADAEVTLVDETQEMNDDNLMFDTSMLEEQEKDVAEKEVSATDLVTTAGELVTTANVEVTTINAPTTTINELTLAQTLIEIKAAKPKVVTYAATTTTTTRPKARGVVVQEPSEFKTTSSSLQASQLPQAKDKGKGIMVVPEVPIKKKDQVSLIEEMARNLKAQLQAELIEEERLARQKEEEANIPLLESWDNTQAMMDADFQLAQQMQTKEQEQLKEAEMKRHIEIVKDNEVTIDAIPLATKPPVIVDYKIDKDGRMGYFKLIRADGSSKRNLKIQKMNIKFRGGLLGLKDFKMILRVTTAQIWYDEDIHDLRSIETEFPSIVFNDALTSKVALSCEPTVSPLNDNQIDFRISFDESDDEDYMVIYDKSSFSYKIISVNDLKMDSENDNDKVNMPSFSSSEPTVNYFDDFDYFKDFEKELPAIAYNDALTSKLDFSKPTVSPQHIDEFDETSMSESDDVTPRKF
ncbi:hypothetical protein Tco_0305094 [Tanacetum coccineum]